MRFDYDPDTQLIEASIGYGAGAFTEAWTLATARSILEELSRTISLATADTAGPPERFRWKYTFPDGTDPEWVEKWAAKMTTPTRFRETSTESDVLTFYYRDVPVFSVDNNVFDLILNSLPISEQTELFTTLRGKANQKSSRTKVAR